MHAITPRPVLGVTPSANNCTKRFSTGLAHTRVVLSPQLSFAFSCVRTRKYCFPFFLFFLRWYHSCIGWRFPKDHKHIVCASYFQIVSLALSQNGRILSVHTHTHAYSLTLSLSHSLTHYIDIYPRTKCSHKKRCTSLLLQQYVRVILFSDTSTDRAWVFMVLAFHNDVSQTMAS